MDSQSFAGPVIGIFCSGLNAYCMQTRLLFLRISGSSGVLKAFLLERNRKLSCNPKKKKHWSARGLSFLGRVHVAKQVLAASLWYHATFQQPPKQLLQQISRQLSQYVAFFFFFFFWEGKIFITQVQ